MRRQGPVWDTAPIWEGASITLYTLGQLRVEKICISYSGAPGELSPRQAGLGRVQAGLPASRQGQFAVPSVAGGTIWVDLQESQEHTRFCSLGGSLSLPSPVGPWDSGWWISCSIWSPLPSH